MGAVRIRVRTMWERSWPDASSTVLAGGFASDGCGVACSRPRAPGTNPNRPTSVLTWGREPGRMPDCPLADDCPSFSERIEGMGCQHYGDRGGAEWCQHYNQPIRDLKAQPVKPGEEVVVEVTDIHESGAGVGRTDDGFIVLVDGILPEARAKVRIDTVRSNHAKAEEVERLPTDDEEDADADEADADDGDAAGEDSPDSEEETADENRRRASQERLGSRDNFWGGDD